jgi:hypothetical protein
MEQQTMSATTSRGFQELQTSKLRHWFSRALKRRQVNVNLLGNAKPIVGVNGALMQVRIRWVRN